MGLIHEQNAQYYSGQRVLAPTTLAATTVFAFGNSATAEPSEIGGFNTELISAFDSAGNQVRSASNFTLHNLTLGTVIPENQIYVSNPSTNELTITAAGVAIGTIIMCQLKEYAIDQNHGSYSYISLNDIIDNFIVAYTGEDQILNNIKRSQVLFHAKRSIQEFSYDTFPVMNSQELNIPPSLSLPIPQDYVNYVRVAWVDSQGILHTINPLYGLTTNPTELPLQDTAGVPTQNSFGENNEAQQSITEERWETANDNNITGNYDPFNFNGVYDYTWWKQAYGQRYGLSPETSNVNGWFSINERTGQFSFSSDLANKIVIIKYISDGLAYDNDMRIPKMAEEAMYMSMMYNIVASRRDVDGGTKAFYKREKYVKTRNAKIRLQNLKLDEIIQVFRGQSKWIKH